MKKSNYTSRDLRGLKPIEDKKIEAMPKSSMAQRAETCEENSLWFFSFKKGRVPDTDAIAYHEWFCSKMNLHPNFDPSLN